MKNFVLFPVFVIFITGVMASQEGANLTKITWGHAINSVELLKNALQSNINFIEADVSMGTLYNTTEVIPIMAHPPNQKSDLSLAIFLKNISDHNLKPTNETKGVKLDFKSIEAFENSLNILKTTYSTANFPIWLNADIIRGPYKPEWIPVDPVRFLAGCKMFPNAILSLGWTTYFNESFKNQSYTQNNIGEMLSLIKANSISNNLTFPVRAVFASNNIENMRALVNESRNSTITIWSGQEDIVDIPKLRKLIFSVGLNRTYVDIPKDIYDKLDLGSSGAKFMPLTPLFFAVFAFILSNIFL